MRYELNKIRGDKLRLFLIFEKDTLLDEIANLAYSQGDSAKIEDPSKHDIHQFLDIIEDGNIKRIDRTLRLAIDRCKRLLYRWTKIPSLGRNTSYDNRRDERGELTMELFVNEGFSDNLAQGLLTCVNEYLEVYVLRDWAGITYKDGYEYWNLRLMDAEEDIKKCLELAEEDDDAVLYCGW